MKKSAIICALLAGAFWGTIGTFVNFLANMGFSSMQISFLRLLSASLAMAIFLLFYNPSLFKLKLRDFWMFILIGVVGIYGTTFFNFWCINFTTISVASVLLQTSPFFVIFFSAVFFKEKITPIKIIALILAVIGCAATSGLFGSSVTVSAIGFLTGIGGSLCYAFYSIFSLFVLKKGYHPFTISFYAFAFAAVFSVIYANPKSLITTLQLNTNTIGTLLFILLFGIVTTVLPFVLYTVSLKNIPAGVASIFATVDPVFSSMLGYLIFSQTPNIIGILLILSSVVLVNLTPIKEGI